MYKHGSSKGRTPFALSKQGYPDASYIIKGLQCDLPTLFPTFEVPTWSIVKLWFCGSSRALRGGAAVAYDGWT
jgi:hypothetical protein